MTQDLAWALAILSVLGIGYLYNLHRIAETLKKILGHMAGVSADVNGIAEHASETAEAVKRIRDNASKK